MKIDSIRISIFIIFVSKIALFHFLIEFYVIDIKKNPMIYIYVFIYENLEFRFRLDQVK